MDVLPRRSLVTRRAITRVVVLGVLLAGFPGVCWWTMIRMPGKSWRGSLPELTTGQAVLRDALRRDVTVLGGEIGDRNLYRYAGLTAAAEFLEASLAEAGFDVQRQAYEVIGRTCLNLIAEVPGHDRAEEIIVVGGHYDSVPGCPAANDNATGVAATLALARAFRDARPARTLRFVLFVNEEPPWFQTPDMGSWVYAKACRQRDEKIAAMLSLETIGCYLDGKRSQHYPPPVGLFYPSRGDFIAFVGNFSSRSLVRRVVASFRQHAKFPSEGGALPGAIPGVGWSDHWAFWQEGYPALMVTDTAPFRYPHYHAPTDTPDKIDYDRMARVVDGLEAVVGELAGVTGR